MTYPADKIARAKALMIFGVGPKLLSRISDIPYHTLRDWDDEQRNAHIEPDSEVIDQLKALVR